VSEAGEVSPPPVGRVRLSRLVAAFAWIGLTSIGGGRHAFFLDALVIRRRWLKNEEFVQDLTLAQVLPGPTFSNLAVALGFRLGGWRGALFGGLALVLPGALILLALSTLYFRAGWTPTAGGAMRGMAAAVVGLTFVAAGRVIAGSLRGWRALAIAAVVFLLVGWLRLNTALVLVLAVPASLWLYRPRRPAA